MQCQSLKVDRVDSSRLRQGRPLSQCRAWPPVVSSMLAIPLVTLSGCTSSGSTSGCLRQPNSNNCFRHRDPLMTWSNDYDLR